MRHCDGAAAVLGLPLMSAGRGRREFPLLAEQIFEGVVAPLRAWRCPGAFPEAADRVRAYTGTEFVCPAKALLGDLGLFGIRATIAISGGPVGLAEAMAADADSHRRPVVDSHAPEGFAAIPRRGDR